VLLITTLCDCVPGGFTSWLANVIVFEETLKLGDCATGAGAAPPPPPPHDVKETLNKRTHRSSQVDADHLMILESSADRVWEGDTRAILQVNRTRKKAIPLPKPGQRASGVARATTLHMPDYDLGLSDWAIFSHPHSRKCC
jgi:hypothetical protein